MTPAELEKVYTTELKVFRDKQKQIKLLHTFFMELGKTLSSFSKDLSKLSLSTHGNLTKSVTGAQVGESDSLTVYMDTLSADDNTSYVDIWWKALSIALDHMAQDSEVLAVKMTSDFGSEESRFEPWSDNL